MPRLLGVEIPADKRIEASLTYIYGIGFSTARKILDQTNIDPNLRANKLTPQQLNEIIHAITNNKLKIEGDLRRDVQGHLKRLQAINCYRGIRHRKGLPVRGQRTSTNARTRKGPRKTVGVVRNPEAKAGKVQDLLELWPSQRVQPTQVRKSRKPKNRNRRRCRLVPRKVRRRQLQRLMHPRKLPGPKNQQSQRKNSQPPLQQLRKAFRFRRTKLRSRRSSKPKAAKTFTQALRMCLRPSTTPS